MKKVAPPVQFDEIWAVDWSGARGAYDGVAVARAWPGRDRVEIVAPGRGRRWTRTAVVERLALEIGAGNRLLAGFDFAFSLPAEVMPACGLGPDATIRDVWDRVEAVCEDDTDFYAGRFVEAAPEGLFWRLGACPPGWSAALRAVDRRAPGTVGVRPETVLKLIGAKQVGRAALAGMRALAALTRSLGPKLALWPGPVRGGQSVVVEIFPTLFRRQALGGLAKIRDAETLGRALAAFGARAGALGSAPLSDDATDALVSAAGLRQYCDRSDAFAMPRDPLAFQEGWILGVPP